MLHVVGHHSLQKLLGVRTRESPDTDIVVAVIGEESSAQLNIGMRLRHATIAIFVSGGGGQASCGWSV